MNSNAKQSTKSISKKNLKTNKTDAKQSEHRLMQKNMPSHAVKEALIISQIIWDNYAGNPCTPEQIRQILRSSFKSSCFRYLVGASAAYGFTKGGWTSDFITLEPLGKQAVAPTKKGDDIAALKAAGLRPKILNRFFMHYDGQKFPTDSAAEKKLVELGIPQRRVSDVLSVIKENSLYCGLTAELNNEQYVMVESRNSFDQSSVLPMTLDETESIANENPQPIHNETKAESSQSSLKQFEKCNTKSNKIYISRTKNLTIEENLKELLVFGTFEPIVSTTYDAKTMLGTMKECCAGIIFIEENVFTDTAGKVHKIHDESALIETGSAVALFGDRVIFLCRNGASLPLGLQEANCCNYENDKLDYETIMSLLKTLNSFKVSE